ncbi:SemiSWEET transporter [Zooshikella ganghwensis]|uniref:Glutathione synthetase n=1 Tax=Zooshikella ganghwensis TaxID=202772 RepID=A0A4P9VH86_9GAMM|nr:SemiSWEET transporter [Zooshikella ganghwensis]RDH41487.1 hypothetical protein B9G39_28130 [Zooshikella ganghwensis]
MDISIIIGFIAAFLTTFSFLPQAIKTISTKNTDGISLSMYILFVMGVSFWILYGIFISDLAILSANIVTLLLSSPILYLKIRSVSKRA